MTRTFARLVVLLAALSLGVGQACACAGDLGAGLTTHGALADAHAGHAHVAHAAHGSGEQVSEGHGVHSEQAGDTALPCEGDCDHCAPDPALAQAPAPADAAPLLAFAPDLVAASRGGGAVIRARDGPRQPAALYRRAPAAITPVTLKTRLLT